MSAHERIDDIAQIGVTLIEIQVALSPVTIEGALRDTWALGYCFGVFDALVQRGKLDQYSDGMLLLTLGFARLLEDANAGASTLNVALDAQTDPLFVAGNKKGGSELSNGLPTKTRHRWA